MDGIGGGDEFDAWMKSRMLLKPDDQVELTEAELSEEIPKVLQSETSTVQKNLVIYSFNEGEYVLVRIRRRQSLMELLLLSSSVYFVYFLKLPKPPNTITLFEFKGTALHIESEEAKAQMEEQGIGTLNYPIGN